MSRKQAALQRKVARLAGEWRDPHDEVAWSKRDIVQNIVVGDDDEVQLTIKPARPHCPCCLIDLNNFRKKLCELKGVNFVEIKIVGVPASDRWERTLNR